MSDTPTTPPPKASGRELDPAGVEAAARAISWFTDEDHRNWFAAAGAAITAYLKATNWQAMTLIHAEDFPRMMDGAEHA